MTQTSSFSAVVEEWFNAYCDRCEWESDPTLEREEAGVDAVEHRCAHRPLTDEKRHALMDVKRTAAKARPNA